jgi:Macrocin-O-methyltransferase (TylF)
MSTMKKIKEQFSCMENMNQRAVDLYYYEALDKYWDESIGTNLDKLRAFTKYVPLGEFPKLFAKYEIFKKILNVHGAIIECGVHQGAGLMTWGILSSIFEPVNHIRKIVGFDTFEGFVSVNEKDRAHNDHIKRGGLAVRSFEDVKKAIRHYDTFRPLGHINKVELVKGDASLTIESYIEKNPHLVVALLYLDFDVFEPTRDAIKFLRSRMPKGAVIAFDELYIKQWPGETQAVHETLGLSNLRIERFPFHPQISYAILD